MRSSPQSPSIHRPPPPLRPVFAVLSLATAILLPSSRATPLAFRTDILPVLTKAGCNAGACHGAATGQAGFRLSLLGYDPEEDFLRITRELGGRRIQLDAPQESLLLRKAARDLDHEGGRRLPRDSEGYATLARWIESGTPWGPADLHVVSIDVAPTDALLPAPDATVSLRVEARLSDATSRDVTRLALYTANDDGVARVSKSGVTTAVGPGLASIMIRFGGHVAAARVAIPYASPRPNPLLDAGHVVDTHVGRELARLGLDASPLCDDATFLRRVTLDLAGRLPSVDEVKSFLDGPGTGTRRTERIDALLASTEFVDYWAWQFAELLLLGGKGSNENAIRRYHWWLRDQVEKNRPLDQLVRELLTASGSITSLGPANFFTLATDPRDLSEHVARMFLGTRMACARCHAHPSDRWTQDDYHRFAAYFARVARDGDLIESRSRGEVDHPKTGRAVSPKPLGIDGSRPAKPDAPDSERRQEVADWITSPDNPFFARAFVNRVWRQLFARGLVEPIDDLRPTNPASHPALLDELARDWARQGFDLRRLLRTLATSRTYQLAGTALPSNRADTRLFSRAYPRELPAPVFFDAVGQATGVSAPFHDSPEAERAVLLASPQTPSLSLDILGRCSRERTCDSPGRSGGGLARALHLLNGSLIHDRLTGGIVDELLSTSPNDSEVVQRLYFQTLSRPAHADELREACGLLTQAPNRRHAIEDLLWALLNSREFGFNH